MTVSCTGGTMYSCVYPSVYLGVYLGVYPGVYLGVYPFHICGVREEYSTLYSPQYWSASSRLQVGHTDLEYRPENVMTLRVRTLPFPVINFQPSDV